MRNIEKLKKRAVVYIKDNKKYIIAVSIMYFVLFLLYFIFFLFYPQQVPGEVGILDGVKSRKLLMDSVDLTFIFENWWNRVLLFFGILIFGFVFSVGVFLYILLDTSLFGLSLARFIQYDNIDQIYLILVHQIFSLPIILLALALSLKLSISLYKKVFKETDIKIMKEIKEVFKFYFIIIVPLFLITYVAEILVVKYLL